MEKTTALPVFDTTAPYNIKREYYKTGFECFQKKFILKRNWIMLVLFFILFVSFVASAVANPSNKTAYFLMMICLAGMFVLWYNPRKQKRMVLDAVRELEFEQFTACNDGKVLRIQICQTDDEEERIPMCRSSTSSIWSATKRRCSTSCQSRRWHPLRQNCPKRSVRKAVQTARHDCFT